jgi:hypothetical protein
MLNQWAAYTLHTCATIVQVSVFAHIFTGTVELPTPACGFTIATDRLAQIVGFASVVEERLPRSGARMTEAASHLSLRR